MLVAWALGLAAVVAAKQRHTWPPYLAFHVWLSEHAIPDLVRNFDSLLLFTIAALLGAVLATRMFGGTVGGHLCLQIGRAGWARVVLLSLIPMVGGGAILAAISDSELTSIKQLASPVIKGVVRAPIMEELLFRGLLVSVTAAVLTWQGRPFWCNATAAAALFASTHVSWTLSGVVNGWHNLLVTGIGGLWYTWLLSRWRSLWVPMILHAGMNLGWLLAGATGGAGGGGLAINLLRAATITIATWWTVRATRN